jgi:hypothetical protein
MSCGAGAERVRVSPYTQGETGGPQGREYP